MMGMVSTGASGSRVAPAASAIVLLAGGKTGGHVYPALALAEELEHRGLRAAWVGNEGGIEERLARARGLEFHGLPAAPLVGRSVLQRGSALWLLLRSAWRARSLVRRTGADVVVGTGGFVSAPAVLGAWLARRPVLLLEPNAEAGVANRLLSRFADVAAVAHEDGAKGLHCETFVAGVPVRAAFFHVGPVQSDTPPRLLVLGGSQGARAVNTAVIEALVRLADGGAALEVLHQCGAEPLAAAAAGYGSAFESFELAGDSRFRRAGVVVELTAYLEDVPGALARAGLVVSRAGAITLAELCAAGRAAVLVPLELAGGHQARNAEALERAGAAVMLRERELEALADTLRDLLAEPARTGAMAERARRLAHPDAARQIADRVASLLVRRSGRRGSGR
jgi:UDP-N-acetylglucosamine--N-acetylmuramyl-(pentapeptide) pyrophosphoryl-undecaprenol N-acetylglucosamine transferase